MSVFDIKIKSWVFKQQQESFSSSDAIFEKLFKCSQFMESHLRPF